MQLFGAISLLLCVISMVAVVVEAEIVGLWSFGIALLLMGISLACLVWEIWISGGALRIMLADVKGAGSGVDGSRLKPGCKAGNPS